MSKLDIKNKKIVIIFYWIGIITNIIHIYIKIIKEESGWMYIATILMSLYLIKTLSFYRNNIVNLGSVFILYASVMGLIDSIYPWSFWMGFIVFVPLLVGIILLLYMLIKQKKDKK